MVLLGSPAGAAPVNQAGTAGAGKAASPQASQGAPERLTAQNLVIQAFEPNQLVLGNDRYIYTLSTGYTSASGKRITRSDLKVGQVVDVTYLTGGKRSEGYPFRPFDKVLVLVRVVADVKQR